MSNLDFNANSQSSMTGLNSTIMPPTIVDFIPISINNEDDDVFFNPLKQERGFNDDAGKKTIGEKHCTTCRSTQVFRDPQRGEIICLGCGVVISDHVTDSRGIRVYTQEDVKRKVHHEPMMPGMHLQITALSNDRNWARRKKLNDRTEWKVKKVLTVKFEISKLKGLLNITRDVEEYTMKEVEKIFWKTNILRGRYALATGIALLYYACLKLDSPIRLKDIVACYEHDDVFKGEIRSMIRTLQKEAGYKFVPKRNYAKFVTSLCSKLGLPQTTCTRAIHIVNDITSNMVISGDPSGVVGGCIYEACKELQGDLNSRRTQMQIAKAIKMTDVTVRRRAKMVRDYLRSKDSRK